MASGQILQMNVRSLTEARTDGGEKATNHSNHGRRSLSPQSCNRDLCNANEVSGMDGIESWQLSCDLTEIG